MEIEVIKKNYIDDENEIKEVKKTRVAAYARVSTDLEEQQSSFISQQKYYLDKICDNPDWAFVDIYADEGISGTQTAKRENFQRMIKDACEGNIDLILTKSISRFARNTVDTLKYVRLLRSKDVAVIFEEENINTMDMGGELLLTILSSVAQQESETLSSHIKLGFKMKKERGELVGYNNCYGYKADHKKNTMQIVERKAKIVRLIFKCYLEGMGCRNIRKMLQDMKILSPGGKEGWCDNTILGILKNEKYVGDVVQGKTFTVDSLTHKRLPNNGEEDKYYIKDHHEPIVSREDFEKVQELLNSKSRRTFTGRTHTTKKFSFSGRFRCGFCGKLYCKKSISKKDAWDCRTVNKVGRMYCENSKLMYESVIKDSFMEGYRLLVSNDNLEIENFIKELSQVNELSEEEIMIKRLEVEKKDIESKISRLVDLLVEGKIDNSAFDRKQQSWRDEITRIDDEIYKIKIESSEDNKLLLGMNKIKDIVLSRKEDENDSFNEELFDELVDYGLIGAYDEGGRPDSYVIRFICKNGFEFKPREDLRENMIIENSRIGSEKIYTTILDFTSKQQFYIFKNENGRNTKTLVNQIRVLFMIER